MSGFKSIVRDSSNSDLNMKDESRDSSISHKPSLLSILSPIKSATTLQVQEPSKNHFFSESSNLKSSTDHKLRDHVIKSQGKLTTQTSFITSTSSSTSSSLTSTTTIASQSFTTRTSTSSPSPTLSFSSRSTAQSFTTTTAPVSSSTTFSSEVSSSKSSVETPLTSSRSGRGLSNGFFNAQFPFTGFAHIQDLNDIQLRTRSRLLSRKTGSGAGSRSHVLSQSGTNSVNIFKRGANFR